MIMTQMVLERLSFYSWLKTEMSPAAEEFRETFRDELHNIPKRLISSKMLRDYINIDTAEKEGVFKRAFLEYFREKLNTDN